MNAEQLYHTAFLVLRTQLHRTERERDALRARVAGLKQRRDDDLFAAIEERDALRLLYDRFRERASGLCEERDALRSRVAGLERTNQELRDWRDSAIAACAKRRCSERDAELDALRQRVADLEVLLGPGLLGD